MNQASRRIHFCPMHSDVRWPGPGKCPECDVELLPVGTRFATLRYMSHDPMNFIVATLVAIGVLSAVFLGNS